MQIFFSNLLVLAILGGFGWIIYMAVQKKKVGMNLEIIKKLFSWGKK